MAEPKISDAALAKLPLLPLTQLTEDALKHLGATENLRAWYALDRLLDQIGDLRPEWRTPRVFIGGANTMGDATTTFEDRSNWDELGVLARSRTAGLALLALLRVIVDKRNVYEGIEELLDLYPHSAPAHATLNELSPAAPRIVLVLAASEAAHAETFALDHIVRHCPEQRSNHTIAKFLDQLDVWTLPRMRDTLRPLTLQKTPARILEAMDETM